MFSNLIESASHNSELKRRGSFFLFALGGYGILFAGIGVASVMAYDASLDRQNLELVSLISPTDYVKDTPAAVAHPKAAPAGTSTESLLAPPPSNDPTLVPKGAQASTTQAPPLPPGVTRYEVGPVDLNPVFGGPKGDGSTTGSGSNDTAFNGVKDIDPPPPINHVEPKTEKPKPTMSKGVVNSLATDLPKPKFTPFAIAAGAQGLVTVQILIDEKGKVVSARAISGHPLLVAEAVRAALGAKFTPTYLSGEPVKVSGIIKYNFQRQ